MLFVHEVHRVIGLREDDHEAAYRDRYMPGLGATDDARLLFYTKLAHGSGDSYRVVTVTAVRDFDALGRLVDRVQTGDLQDTIGHIDTLRHGVYGKTLVPLPWSRLQEIDLSGVASTCAPGGEREPYLYMQDTMWPIEGKYDEYVERSGSFYATWMASEEHREQAMLHIEASFRPAFGSHERHEVVMWQRVVKPERLLQLLTHEMLPEHKAPGTWMHEGLQLRDQWQSQLLRVAGWSPGWTVPSA